MSKNVLKIILCCILIFAGIYLLFAILAGYSIYDSNKQRATNARTSDQVMIEWLTKDKHFDLEQFTNTYQIEEISIPSSHDDHMIPASYIYAKGNDTKNVNTVIMVHGLLGNRLSNYPMAQLFLDKGFNVITYDQRSSGNNTAPFTTFGYLESYDTLDYIQYANEFLDDDDLLGIWGQSMGAATVANAMDEKVFNDSVDFAVLDSPFGNMEDELAGQSFFDQTQLFFASIFSKINLGFFYQEQRVYPQLKKTSIPIMVVCCKSDTSISCSTQEKIFYSIVSDKKILFEVDDSEHSNIYFDHTEMYINMLSKLLENLVD